MYLECVENEGKCYYSLFQGPILVEASITGEDVIKYRSIAGEKGRAGLYSKIFCYKGKLLLIPWNASFFSIYDIDKDETRTIDIPKKDRVDGKYGFFRNAVQKGGIIYAFGVNYPGIVRVDIEKEQADCILFFTDTNIGASGFIGEMAESGVRRFIPLNSGNQILAFDTSDESINVIDIKVNNAASIRAVCCDREGFWIVFSDGTSYTCNFDFEDMNKQEALTALLQSKREHLIRSGVYYDDCVFLFPENGNSYIRFSCIDLTGEWMKVPIKGVDECFYYVASNEKGLSIFCEDMNCKYTYDRIKGEFIKSKKQLSAKEYIKLMLSTKDVGLMKEDGILSLDTFLKTIIE